MDKYFLIDIDGCITDGKNKNVDMKAFTELCSLLTYTDINYSLCTGRSANYVESVAQFLSFDGWAICENGSYLYHTKTDKMLISEGIASNFQDELFNIKVNLNESLGQDCFKYELGKEMSISMNPFSDSIEAFFYKVKGSLSSNQLELMNVDHSTTAVDITASGINKKTGFYNLIHTGIADKDSYFIGIGDSSGDIPFLEECDFSASPQNATDPVKELVDYVSEYSSTKGVIEIVKHCISL